MACSDDFVNPQSSSLISPQQSIRLSSVDDLLMFTSSASKISVKMPFLEIIQIDLSSEFMADRLGLAGACSTIAAAMDEHFSPFLCRVGSSLRRLTILLPESSLSITLPEPSSPLWLNLTSLTLWGGVQSFGETISVVGACPSLEMLDVDCEWLAPRPSSSAPQHWTLGVNPPPLSSRVAVGASSACIFVELEHTLHLPLQELSVAFSERTSNEDGVHFATYLASRRRITEVDMTFIDMATVKRE